MLILLLQLCTKLYLIIKIHVLMKKPSFRTEQNAVIKRTLSFQQLIMNYMDLPNIQIKDLKVIL